MWQEEQWANCPGCGKPRDEVWVDSPAKEQELRYRLRAEPTLCVACDVQARARENFEKEGESAYAGGVFYVLRDDAEQFSGD